MKTTIKLLLLAVLLAACLSRANVVVGPITNALNGHTYYVVDQQSWSNAQAEAQSIGGHLATIRNVDENNWIITNILTDFTSSGGPNLTALPVWMGLYDPIYNDGSQHEADFIWISGETNGYRNWESGEPNNNGNQEYYGTINWHYAAGYDSTRGTWNDCPLNGTTGYPGNSTGPYYGLVEIGTDLGPTLVILPNGPQSVQLLWTTNGGFTLQQSANLLAPSWQSSGYPVTVVNGSNNVSISPATNSIFFRLVEP